MRIEVTVSGSGGKRPVVKRNKDGSVTVTSDVPTPVAHNRAVWARTFKAGALLSHDGNGLLVGPSGKLSLG